MSREHSLRRYRRIGLGIATGFLARGIATVASIVSVPLLVAYAGKADYGLLLAAQSVVAWMSLLDLGISGSLTNHVADASGKEDRPRIQALVATALSIHVLIGLLGAFACLGTSLLPWSRWFPNADPAQIRMIAAVVKWSGLVFFLTLPGLLLHSLLKALQWSHASNILLGCSSLLGLVATFLGIRAGLPLPALAACIALAGALPQLVAFKYVATRLGVSSLWRNAFSRPALKPLLVIGLPICLFQFKALLVNNTALLMISNRCGFAIASDFGLALNIYGFVFFFGACVAQPFYPAAREAYARGDYAWVRRGFARILLLRLLITVVCSAPLLFWGDDLLRLWSGKEMAQPFGLSGWSWVFSLLLSAAFTSTVSDFLLSLDRIWSQFVPLLLNAAILLLLLHLTLPAWGAKAGFMATLFSNLVPVVWCVYLLRSDPRLRARPPAH